MKRFACTVVALLFAHSLARAQGGIGLFVGDCGSGTSTTQVSNLCTQNSGTAFTAYATCVLPLGVKQDFVRAVGVLDIQTNQTVIPDWWRADDCRSTGFVVSADAFMGGSCTTLWDAVAPAATTLTAWVPDPGGRPAHIRFLVSIDLDTGSAYDLAGDGTTEISVFRLTVLKVKSFGVGACDGCSAGACVVLNEINLQSVNDLPEDYLRLTNGSMGNFITYNSDAPACPSTVPVVNRTWGALKALYR